MQLAFEQHGFELQRSAYIFLFSMNTYSSVQLTPSVMSNSLRLHGLWQARSPCPSPIPRAYSNSCPSSQWCIQPSHPLSSPSPAFNLSQHQGQMDLDNLWMPDSPTPGLKSEALLLAHMNTANNKQTKFYRVLESQLLQ